MQNTLLPFIYRLFARFALACTQGCTMLTVLFFLILLAFQYTVNGQQKTYTSNKTDVFPIRLDNQYYLTSVSIIPNSEIVQLRNQILPKHQYTLEYQLGYLQLSDSLPYSIFDTLRVTYQALLIRLPKKLQLHYPEYQLSADGKDSMFIRRSVETALSSESIFGKELEKSGSIIRGFTVGTNRDLTVQSGFRLQLSGRISEDIELTASLTDENSPIQPEGNTERLDELDKIFIQVRHPNANAIFGDFDLQKRQGEFGVINRKLQGLTLELKQGKNEAFAAFATARGKFTTNTLTGADAVQGPYQLLGRNNERDIIIIAGSEKVFLNGEPVKRGELNDYVIDYGNAQITFTQSNIITSASRIFIEFEYTDRRFTRNVFSAGASSTLFSDRLNISLLYMRDGDNQDSPIDISISDADKRSLEAAGDMQSRAVKSGVSLAEYDSTTGRNRGYYERVDSMINGSTTTFYRYSPNSVTAAYNITFSYLGSTQGSYIKDAPGVFRYVGTGAGAYDTIIALPLPELRQFSSLQLSWNQKDQWKLSFEAAISSIDKNRFSNLDDNDNLGAAGLLFLEVKPQEINVNSFNLGKLSGSWKERFIQSRFSPAERIGEVEFNRSYNISENNGVNDEALREINLGYAPRNWFNNSISYGHLKREQALQSTRWLYQSRAEINKDMILEFTNDFAQSQSGSYRSTWYKQSGKGSYKLNSITPGFSFSSENKKDNLGNIDSLIGGSLKFIELRPSVEAAPAKGLRINGEYIYRDDYSALQGIMMQEAISRGFNIDGDYNSGTGIQTSLIISSLEKSYSKQFTEKGLLNSQVILLKSQSRVTPIKQLSTEILYAVSTQKSAKLDRVFVLVTKGFGNYRYVGDLNNNGIQDESEYEPTLYDGDYSLLTLPSDKLYPVIDLKTGLRLRYNLQQVFETGSMPDNILKIFSFETYSRIEENSTVSDLKKIYLLNLGSFLHPNTTIRGLNLLEHSVFIWENQSDFNIKLFYAMQKGMGQYGTGIERLLKKEQSVRIKFRLVEEISGQTDLYHTEDASNTSSLSVRNRSINTDGMILDFSYRPYPMVETGIKLKSAQSVDEFPQKPTKLSLNSQSIRINFSFRGAGRLRLEFERSELLVNLRDNYLPYELTEGNGIGKNYFIRTNFDYKIAENLQSTAGYDGRSLSGSKFIHTMRAELRAFF